MVHDKLKNSGLASMYNMSPVVDSKDERAKFLNKIVRYKKFDSSNGTITRDYDFIIKEVQTNHEGKPCLRGYAVDRKTNEVIDTFGRVINIEDVEIIS